VTGLANERQRRLVVDSLLIGVAGAVSAELLTYLIHLCQGIFLGDIAGYTAPGLPTEGGVLTQVIGPHGLWLIPLVTTLGGLLSGILIYFVAPDAPGHGTNEVVRAFHRTGGFIRKRIPPLEMIAAPLTIGAGGSTGREGPITLIVGGIGAVYADLRHHSEEERRLLAIVGMGAGLSAIFRTPVGAAIFAIEVLYSDMEFETDALLFAILGSVSAYTVNGILRGAWNPPFVVSPDLGATGTDYLEYAVLGVAGGLVATMLPFFVQSTHRLFHHLSLPIYIKTALGGVIVGLIALVLPQVMGGGYGWMQEAINGQLSFKVLLALVFAKMIATSFTLGSGGPGGDFAPTLFVGAMLGGTMADVFGRPSAAFVVVGMAAVFSGAGRVPIATLFMVTEMTGGYHLLPAAALVVTLSYLVQDTLTSRLKYKTLYGSQIPRRSSRDIDLLEGVLVSDAMTKDFESVPGTMPLKELASLFERTHHHGFPVVDDEGKWTGIVTLGDLHKAILEPTFETQTVADIATMDGLAVAYPDESMSMALWRMGVRRVGRLPVVDRQDNRRLIGLVRREDIIDAYERAIATRKDTSARLRELRETHEGNVRVLEVDVSGQHPLVGKPVRELAALLPRDCILVSIRRDKRVIIPHGDTTIQKGDHLVTLVSVNCEDEARQALTQRD
jgi:CIC family chloride channel protein